MTALTNLLPRQGAETQIVLTAEAPTADRPTPAETAVPHPAITSEALAADAPAPETAMPAAVSQPLTSESLLQRQEELNQREHDLTQLERQIDLKLTELQELETRLKTMLNEADASRDSKLRHLVDVYTNMKARQAAEVIQTLDQSIAVKILANMRGRQAGEILTYVQPEIAAKLSEALTRVQLPTDY